MGALNINVKIDTGSVEDEHWHIEPEFIYVVDGSCSITIEEKIYALPQNEMLLINSGKRHSIAVKKDGMLCRIYLPYHDICEYIKQDYIFLNCNSLFDSGHKYEQLKNYVKELLMAHMADDEQLFAKMSVEYKILDYLLKYFRVDFGKKQGDGSYIQNQRMSIILNYIYAKYEESVSLSEIAEKVYMTPSSLSRFFKKATGESFVQFVRRIRLQKAAEQLIYSQISIAKIAVNNGFSNPSAMNKDFKDMYGITPKEYRKVHQMEKIFMNKELERKRLREILGNEEKDNLAISNRKVYRIDTKKCLEYRLWGNRILNVGHASIMESAIVRKQLLELKERINFEYIRIWSIFSSNMLFAREGKKLKVNFSKLDEILDFCVENQFKLYFDLAQRRNKAMASNAKEIWSEEEGLVFINKNEWETFLESFIVHITKRYGKRIVSDWIYEFTFFLNDKPYYANESYTAKNVWDRGYEIIKENIPDAKVAGPGLLLTLNEDAMEFIVQDFFAAKHRPDIFTTINLPFGGKQGEAGFQRITEDDFLEQQIQMIKRILNKFEFQGEYHVTDWGNSMANRNYIQDSCHRATYILRNVTRTYHEADELGLWYATDRLNMYYDSEGILNGCAGLMTRDGICKPALYAFEFLNSMGCYYLDMSECYLATKDERNDVQLLVYNHKKLGPRYFLVEEDVHQPEEIERLFVDQDVLNFEVTLDHMEDNCLYEIRQKIISPKSGSILEKWIELGCEKYLLGEDIAYLKRVSIPKVAIHTAYSIREKLHLNLQLLPHEIRWISIKKI